MSDNGDINGRVTRKTPKQPWVPPPAQPGTAWKLLLSCHTGQHCRSTMHIDNDVLGTLPYCCGEPMAIESAAFVVIQHALLAP